jgi:hypothetical protein
MDLREARRRQTLCEADRLAKEVEDWVNRLKGDGRYQTQLSAISADDTVANRTAEGGAGFASGIERSQAAVGADGFQQDSGGSPVIHGARVRGPDTSR